MTSLRFDLSPILKMSNIFLYWFCEQSGSKNHANNKKRTKNKKKRTPITIYIYIYIYIYGNYKNPDGPKNGARVSLQQNLTSLETP